MAPAIFKFDEKIYADFKAACKKEGRSMVWVLTEFMKNFIASREAGK
jgi:hypothetical protein